MEGCKQNAVSNTAQSQGSGDSELGVKRIVLLSVTLETTGKTLHIPCYVVDSTTLLWQGAIRNCGI